MNKEESFPELSARWPGGWGRGLAGETESDSFSDVGRGKSGSDKAHFPQKHCSLIFLITNTGHGGGKVARRKKVLNNINIMKHS